MGLEEAKVQPSKDNSESFDGVVPASPKSPGQSVTVSNLAPTSTTSNIFARIGSKTASQLPAGSNSEAFSPSSSKRSSILQMGASFTNDLSRGMASALIGSVSFLVHATRMSTFVEFKFENPRWLFFPLTGSAFITIFCAVLIYCQGLEAKSQGIFMRNAEAVSELIWNPETYTPCFDAYMHEACWPQYAAMSFFAFVGFAAMVETYLCYRSWKDFHNENFRVEGSELYFQKFCPFLYAWMKCILDVRKKFSPGGRLFWFRAWLLTMVEIVLQVIRGFVLNDAYARMSAGQTLAQTILIVSQFNVFLLIYYYRSEVGYVFSGFYFEIAYLIVRVSLFGALSLRSSGVWDFLTIGVPLLICIADMHEILNFIIHAVGNPSMSPSLVNERRRNGILVVLVGFLVTTGGLLLFALIIKTGYVDECPRVYDREERPPGFLVPMGLDCYSWQYNIFLAPACSCLYLNVNTWLSDDCAGFGENEHQVLVEILPHLDDLRFLNVWQGFSDDCRPMPEDLDLFAGLQHLHRLMISEFFVESIPETFAQLTDLRALEIGQGHIKNLDKNMFNNWPKLETFSCFECPHLDNLDAVRGGTHGAILPLLKTVEVHGVRTCPSGRHRSGRSHSFICTELDAPETCAGYPEWLMQSFIEGIHSSRDHNECVPSLCGAMLHYFSIADIDRDYLMNYGHGDFFFGVRLQTAGVPEVAYTEEMHHCFVHTMRKHLNATYQENYDGVGVENKLTHMEFLSMHTKYTTCADCEKVQDVSAQRKAIYEDSISIDFHDPCWMMPSNSVDTDYIRASCMSNVTECNPSVCPLGIQSVAPYDQDLDLIFPEPDFNVLTTSLGAAWGREGTYVCFAHVAPECLDATLPDGSRAMSFTNVLKVGFATFQISITDCSECDYLPKVGERSPYHGN